MKAILLSIKPQHLANILNGKKIIEVRKNVLPLNVPVYLYCTIGKPYLVNFGDYEHPYKAGGIELGFDLKNIEGHEATILNGKVVAKCVFSEVKELKWGRWVGQEIFSYRGWNYEHDELLTKTCLTNEQLQNYGDNKKIYLHHISNPEIFDTPKELGEFYVLDKVETKRYDGFCKVYKPITKAPKSWCYVEVEE